MKVLILTPLPFWHPETKEFIHHLKTQGITAEAIDILNGYKYQNDQVISLVPRFYFGALRKVYLKVFRCKILEYYVKHFDIVDIHFVDSNYFKLIKYLPSNLICSLFGSDLLRTTDKQNVLLKHLFLKSKKIVLSKNMVDYFNQKFDVPNDKFFFTQYGSSKLSLISQLSSNQTEIHAIKKRLNISLDSIVVTCGYNAKKVQQHTKMLSKLNLLSKEYKDKITLILPMTYGETSEKYQNEILILLVNSNINYVILRDHLEIDEYIDYKLISDITINTQTTDALASSIKESFVNSEVLLLADWLNYDLYLEMGVYYRKINFENLPIILTETIDNLKHHMELAKNNPEIILSFASWDNLINDWITLYKTVKNGS